MCFIVKKKDFEIKVATEDIKCYKIVDKCDNGIYKSMYQFFDYRLNTLFSNESLFSEAVNNENKKIYFAITDGIAYVHPNKEYFETIKLDYKEGYVFRKGGFHSFKDIERKDVFGMGFVAVECIIPKGSRYIEGIDLIDKKDAYFSEKIILKRELEF